MKRTLAFLVFLLAATLLVSFAQAEGLAELVLTNGHIYTVDPRIGRVEALAIAR